MIKLLKNCKLFTPVPMGIKDILIAGKKIIEISDNIKIDSMKAKVYDLDGMTVTPGFIDQHVHIIGGGGEGGCHTRTPEVMLSNVIKAGITTIVGVLGTDATSRHLESLLAKARGLNNEGITTYIYTGSYEVPVITMTGGIRKDIFLIKEVIGTGEIAISDHRSSEPTLQELKRIITDTRLGGMLSSKAGIVNFHIGAGKKGIDPLLNIVKDTEIPIKHIVPTHLNRNNDLLDQGIEFAKMGGYIDITSGMSSLLGFDQAVKPSKGISKYFDLDAPVDKITMSSDGNGSMASYNEKGEVERFMVASLDSLLNEFIDLVKKESLSLDLALPVITSNPAKMLGIYPYKGCLKPGSDADILVLDENLQINMLFAMGKKMIEDKKIIEKGTFE